MKFSRSSPTLSPLDPYLGRPPALSRKLLHPLLNFQSQPLNVTLSFFSMPTSGGGVVSRPPDFESQPESVSAATRAPGETGFVVLGATGQARGGQCACVGGGFLHVSLQPGVRRAKVGNPVAPVGNFPRLSSDRRQQILPKPGRPQWRGLRYLFFMYERRGADFANGKWAEKRVSFLQAGADIDLPPLKPQSSSGQCWVVLWD